MNTRPKLLFVVTEDWYFVSHRLSLAVAAQKAGFDVAVATRVVKQGETIRAAGIRLIPFSLSRHHGNPVAEVAALLRLYRQERPDIVHHVALKPIVYGTVAAQLARVPAKVNAVAGLGWLFTTTHGMMRLIRPAARWVLAWLLKTPGSLTIVQNPDDRALLVRSRLPEARIRLIRGAGVDTISFRPASKPSGAVCIVLAARMLWAKGMGEFVEAARLLTQAGVSARFALVGIPDLGNPDSVSEATLREWHGRNGVEWWGWQEDMPAVFRAAHIACLPSYYREGLPKVLLEAAASGLPIVTTNAPGCRDVVRDGENGYLVPVRDAQALAQTLRGLIDNAALRAQMGRRAREIALAEFSQERIISEVLTVYGEFQGHAGKPATVGGGLP
jgi:glycosyltransferase involved in cell wall biosynthesis